ncbi:MAG: class I SAM-dependent methyltransferase [Porticoccaceae bacterium]
MSLFVHQSRRPSPGSGAFKVSGYMFAVALLLASSILPRATVAAPDLDVPFVPTPEDVVDRMLEMAAVKPDDRVIDLGSGDGRIVISAVRDWDVRAALGIDLDPERVAEARENARQAGIDDRAVFEQGDLFEKDFSDATVLTMYLLPDVNLRLRPVVLETMAPGTRIVSHAFKMGDWEADQFDTVGTNNIYLWIVPAKVDGRWQLTTADGGRVNLSLTQKYQRFEGSAEIDGAPVALSDTRLRGEQIRFTVAGDSYIGKVEGDTIVPVEDAGAARNWHARRL